MTVVLTPLQSVTAQDLMKESLENLGIYEPSEALDGGEAAALLRTLNLFLDSLSAKKIMIYALTTEAFALTASDESYSIGVNGDFNTTRPERVHERKSYIRDANSLDTYLLPLTKEEYNRISLKTGSDSIPTHMFFDPQYPLARIYFYSPPSTGLTLYLVSEKPFTQFADLTTTVSLPSGYIEMLTTNFAIRLAPKYRKSVSRELGILAAQTMAAVQNNNAEPIKTNVNITPRQSFNINRGY